MKKPRLPTVQSICSNIDMVKEALNHIELLTGQLLVLASPQVDNRGEKNVVHLVQDVMNLFRAESLLHNVEMVFTTAIESIPIVCDEHQIKQVFVNIMKNAFEAMPTGGTLNIDVSLQERQVLISFGDTGRGIETERIQHLGEPFYSTKEKGTGGMKYKKYCGTIMRLESQHLPDKRLISER